MKAIPLMDTHVRPFVVLPADYAIVTNERSLLAY